MERGRLINWKTLLLLKIISEDFTHWKEIKCRIFIIYKNVTQRGQHPILLASGYIIYTIRKDESQSLHVGVTYACRATCVAGPSGFSYRVPCANLPVTSEDFWCRISNCFKYFELHFNFVFRFQISYTI
jgi:hypothetical protein